MLYLLGLKQLLEPACCNVGALGDLCIFRGNALMREQRLLKLGDQNWHCHLFQMCGNLATVVSCKHNSTGGMARYGNFL